MKDRIIRLISLLKNAPPKRLLTIAGFLIVAAAIPFTVAVQQLQQNLQQQAATPDSKGSVATWCPSGRPTQQSTDKYSCPSWWCVGYSYFGGPPSCSSGVDKVLSGGNYCYYPNVREPNSPKCGYSAQPSSCGSLGGTCTANCDASEVVASSTGLCSGSTPYCCKQTPGSCSSQGGTCKSECAIGDFALTSGSFSCSASTPFCCKASAPPTSSATPIPTSSPAPKNCTLNGKSVPPGTQFCVGDSTGNANGCTAKTTYETCQSDGTWTSAATCKIVNGAQTYCHYDSNTSPQGISCLAACAPAPTLTPTPTPGQGGAGDTCTNATLNQTCETGTGTTCPAGKTNTGISGQCPSGKVCCKPSGSTGGNLTCSVTGCQPGQKKGFSVCKNFIGTYDTTGSCGVDQTGNKLLTCDNTSCVSRDYPINIAAYCSNSSGTCSTGSDGKDSHQKTGPPLTCQAAITWWENWFANPYPLWSISPPYLPGSHVLSLNGLKKAQYESLIRGPNPIEGTGEDAAWRACDNTINNTFSNLAWRNYLQDQLSGKAPLMTEPNAPNQCVTASGIQLQYLDPINRQIQSNIDRYNILKTQQAAALAAGSYATYYGLDSSVTSQPLIAGCSSTDPQGGAGLGGISFTCVGNSCQVDPSGAYSDEKTCNQSCGGTQPPGGGGGGGGGSPTPTPTPTPSPTPTPGACGGKICNGGCIPLIQQCVGGGGSPSPSPPPPPHACNPPKTQCGNSCTDMSTDNNNCRSCGTKCTTASGQTCTNGSCQGGTSTGDTKLAFNLGLDGIGAAGDKRNPTGGGNQNPKTTSRNLTVEVYDTNNNIIDTRNDNLTYNTSTKRFTATVALKQGFSNGNYIVKVKSPRYLRKQIGGIAAITAGQTKTMPQANLTAGDMVGNNKIDISDYNVFLSCSIFSKNNGACNQDPDHRINSDLNNDGNVDQDDYALLLREWEVQDGD